MPTPVCIDDIAAKLAPASKVPFGVAEIPRTESTGLFW